jgi:cell division protein FtsQ
VSARSTIKRILFVTLWLSIGGGMFTLLLAAISNKNKDRCSDYHIEILGNNKDQFIDQKDVREIMEKQLGAGIKGRLVVDFNLHSLEQALEKTDWVDDAELYFDNNDLLHIRVTERAPVARIFTISGDSFYIDSSGRSIPLSDKLSARVPVFTGFPVKKLVSRRDSMLLGEVRVTANYICSHPFWGAQVAQIDITPDRRFEMIPVVGNHLVKLGTGEDIDAKFRRLMVFYTQVLSKAGFERYKIIDVQYKGQVVTSRYAGDPSVDSIQLRKNVERLLQQSIEPASDTVIRALPVLVKLERDSAIAPDPSLVDAAATDITSTKKTDRAKGGKSNEEKRKQNTDGIKPKSTTNQVNKNFP